MVGFLVGLPVLVVALPVAASCCYLLTLALASLFHRPPPASGEALSRLVVVVPAHNEAEMIGTCVGSLLDQAYPRERYRVVVVADNCTDATAAAAAAAGAEVMVREAPDRRGKGQALRWAMDRLLAGPDPLDALIVVDADSIADRPFLRELETTFSAGHPVVQSDDVLRTEPHDRRALLEGAALLLRNRVRFAGRAALGMPASLCGNGMLLGRAVLEAHPWQAFSPTEDSEYSLSLLAAGQPTAFAIRARVSAAPTAGAEGAYTQSLRWDGGRLATARDWTLRLLGAGARRRSAATIGVALDLAVPPLGMLVMGTAVGTALAGVLWLLGVVPGWAALPWLVALVALPGYLLVGLASCRVPAATYTAFLLLAPRFLARKLRVYARLARGSGPQGWVRTQRPAEVQGDSDAVTP
jgi:1,2-diacylglycerol 3-beta-glucosyltransferase